MPVGPPASECSPERNPRQFGRYPCATVPAMNATSRDAGLVRKVGPWGLAASVVSIVVGAGIFAVPGALAAAVGPYAPLAFLVCGLAIGAVAICFAEGGSRMPTSGGVYGYIEAAFGPLTGMSPGSCSWSGTCSRVAVSLRPWRMWQRV
jgi:basic amino acid/polyamine antiporter, APA family